MIKKLKKLIKPAKTDLFPDVLKKHDRITPAPPEPTKKPKVTYRVRGFSAEFCEGIRRLNFLEYLRCLRFSITRKGVQRTYPNGTEAKQQWYDAETITCSGWCKRDFPFREGDPRPIRCPHCNLVYGFYTPQEVWVRNGCRAGGSKWR
jgi:hypothetical protein